MVLPLRWPCLALLAACGGGPERIAPAPVTRASPPALTPEQNRLLAAAEKLYRAGDPAWPQARADLARDPATAAWLARMVVRDAVVAFDRRSASDEDFLRQAVGSDPIWDRATAEIAALGATAAPLIAETLLPHPRHDRRRLGVTLLGRCGPAAAVALEPELTGTDPALRRLAVLAVGEMGPGPGPDAALDRAARDGEFTVRAAAWEGMARALPATAPRLRDALLREADPFVRRVIARGLGGDRTRASATALVEYMRASAAADDAAGVTAAHEALSRLADRDPRRPRGIEAWGAWLASQPEQWQERQLGAVEDRSR